MGAIPNKLSDAARRLRVLSDSKEKLEAQLKDINRERKTLKELTIPRLMEDAELDKFSMDDVGTVYIQPQVYVSVTCEPDAFFNWLEANKHADIISEHVHPKRLQSWVKGMLEEGQPLPEGMLKVTLVPTANMRRKGKSNGEGNEEF